MADHLIERHGDLVVRVREHLGRYYSECRRGEFGTSHALTEPFNVDVWFGWAASREQAVLDRLAEARGLN